MSLTSANRDYVTIVSGLPRTGTSMMMQMIEAGGIAALTDDVRKADEDNPRGYYEFEPVKKTRDDPSWLSQAPGKVVKMVHMLLLDLPIDRPYRVVYMQRKLEEVLASQEKMLERRGKKGGGGSERQLMDIFQRQEQKILSWLADKPNFRLLCVNYNELVQDPAPQAGALAEFLGGLDLPAMLAVVDPALHRQRK